MSEKSRSILSLHSDIRWCSKCPLFFKRNNAVPGDGNIDTSVMLIADAPSVEDDGTGTTFSHKVGQLFDKIIGYIGLKREDVFITNLVKCCPIATGSANDSEYNTCFHFVEEQIDIIKPKIIITLGSTATQKLLKVDGKMSALKGNWQEYKGMKVMPTFHPSYLLEHLTDENKASVKSDFDKVKAMLETLKGQK